MLNTYVRPIQVIMDSVVNTLWAPCSCLFCHSWYRTLSIHLTNHKHGHPWNWTLTDHPCASLDTSKIPGWNFDLSKKSYLKVSSSGEWFGILWTRRKFYFQNLYHVTAHPPANQQRTFNDFNLGVYPESGVSIWSIWDFCKRHQQITRWWQLKYFWNFHPYLAKIPILTNIFQMGWNHQLE